MEARASGFAVWEMITPEGVLPLARAMLAEHMKALKVATSPAKLDVTSSCPSCHSTAAAAALQASLITLLTHELSVHSDIAMPYQCMGGG